MLRRFVTGPGTPLGTWLVAVTALAVLATACSSEDGAPSSTAVGSSDQELLPAAALVTRSEEQQRIIHEARETLLRDCMVDKGFEYRVTPFTPSESAQSD